MTRKVKTKILATIGPATDSEKKLVDLINAGADGFRLNFSHGDYNYFEKVFQTIHNVCTESSLPIPILIDLQGPKIRIGELEQNSIEIFTGNTIEITTEEIKGTAKKISTSYKNLPQDARIGDVVLIDDGLIKLEIIDKTGKSVKCKIIVGGTLKPKKGMNLPGMKLSTPALTEKDKENLEFALKHRVDFIALSFVRHEDDITGLKEWLRAKGYDKPVIAKIEKPEAVERFEQILEISDGIMVARGDLGVELAPQLVPIVQKNIIRRCNATGKLVITATQMLESMINNSVPTRAEASDVANAVLDGTDVVMLSAETSVGKYPVETVKIMDDILKTAESQTQFQTPVNFDKPHNIIDNLFDATAKGFAEISNQINASVIVVFTHHGRKAKALAKFRPAASIVAISNEFDTLNILNLHRGIIPYHLENFEDEEESIARAIEILKKEMFVEKNDVIVFTSGAPITDKERRNWIRFHIV